MGCPARKLRQGGRVGLQSGDDRRGGDHHRLAKGCLRLFAGGFTQGGKPRSQRTGKHFVERRVDPGAQDFSQAQVGESEQPRPERIG